MRPRAAGRATTRRSRELLAHAALLHEQARAIAPHAEAIVATAEGRRRATQLVVDDYEHIPADLIAHQLLGVAGAPGGAGALDSARATAGRLDPARIDVPRADRLGHRRPLLPWPSAAARFRDEWLPHADWVELDGVGHCPQLDVPAEAAELIAGFQCRADASRWSSSPTGRGSCPSSSTIAPPGQYGCGGLAWWTSSGS